MGKEKVNFCVSSLEDIGLPYQWKKNLSQERRLVAGFFEKIFVDEMDLPIECIDVGDISEHLTEEDKETLGKSVRDYPLSGDKQINVHNFQEAECWYREHSDDDMCLLLVSYDIYLNESNYFLWRLTLFGDSILSVARLFRTPVSDVSYEERIKYASIPCIMGIFSNRIQREQHPDVRCIDKYCNSVEALDTLIRTIKIDPLRKRVPFCEDCQDSIYKAISVRRKK
ncbi:hypothetical protein MYX07_04660 [Patescibacteria group bacterium AH-259-L07]|nr:hypothetical protein [Patescibacteria group bacterium AH-259-L07]